MVLCWSGNYVAAKIAFREFPALLVMCLRTSVAALLMIPIYWNYARKRQMEWTRREAGVAIALGVFGMSLNQLFWTLGAARTTVIHSSMIVATTPLWVLMIAAALKVERITWPKLAGMFIAILGVALLQVFRPAGSVNGPSVAGDLLVLLCALLLAAMTAFGKLWKPTSGGIAIAAVGHVVGAMLLTPALWWTSRSFNYGHVSTGAWLGVLYMGACSSVTGYLIYYYVLARMPASRIAAFQYLQPVFASVMAMMILGESLTAPAAAAGGIIFAGVYVTERFG